MRDLKDFIESHRDDLIVSKESVAHRTLTMIRKINEIKRGLMLFISIDDKSYVHVYLQVQREYEPIFGFQLNMANNPHGFLTCTTEYLNKLIEDGKVWATDPAQDKELEMEFLAMNSDPSGKDNKKIILDHYGKRYLKYKNKYINLKNKLNI
jgi:hypothetical protein